MAGEGTGPPRGLEPFIHQVWNVLWVLFFLTSGILGFKSMVSIGGRPQSPLLPGWCDCVQTMGGAGAQFLLKFTPRPQRFHPSLQGRHAGGHHGGQGGLHHLEGSPTPPLFKGPRQGLEQKSTKDATEEVGGFLFW